MHVIATAGHVDHGKSTLVQALTGANPDRLEEERRRGLSIELGYCWTTLPPVGEVAFVDVPGHERFISTMLSGIGPVPAVLFVVAADDPWMPQAAEHLAALDAVGVAHGVVAVSRSDLADPTPMLHRARHELVGTSLESAPVLPVSGRTGAGLEALRQALVEVVRALPEPDPAADVRLWVDRSFHMRGAGTVVTGTLPAGRVAVGDHLSAGAISVRVRGLHTLGRPAQSATGVARVALNLTGTDLSSLERGSVLVTPGSWRHTDTVDVRVTGRPRGGETAASARPPERPQLHVGAAAVAVHFRPLGGDVARLALDRPLPLRVGDRALLRDPGSRRLWGVTVLDPAPPRLRRRGAARARAEALADARGTADLAAELSRRHQVPLRLLQQIGVPTPGADRIGVVVDGWVLSPERAQRVATAIDRLVREHDAANPLDPGLRLSVVAQQLRLPSPEVAAALVRPPLRVEQGRVTAGRSGVLPPALEQAIAVLEQELERAPFQAPTADRLRQLRLDQRAVGAASKAGRLLRVADGIVLLPGADRRAAERLGELPQPFTTSEARVRLETSRRVVLPLLEHLDRRGFTQRLPDDRRTVRTTAR